jgi:hypothetical protein
MWSMDARQDSAARRQGSQELVGGRMNRAAITSLPHLPGAVTPFIRHTRKWHLSAAQIFVLALTLAGCASNNARRSHPYDGKKMPHCNGVWVTNDHRTWHCYSHEQFQRWRKRNGL